MVRRENEVRTSINFNFGACNEVRIRFSDNLRQREAVDDIILAQENKMCNLKIRYH